MPVTYRLQVVDAGCVLGVFREVRSVSVPKNWLGRHLWLMSGRLLYIYQLRGGAGVGSDREVCACKD